MDRPEQHGIEYDHQMGTGAESQQERSAWVIGLIQLIFVIAVIAAAVGLSQALKGKANERAPQISDLRGQAEITVRVTQPERINYVPTVRANGTVQATAEVAVSPQVSGEIRRVSASFRAGNEVKKGDLLFEIDRADYILAVERAEAEIAAASSDLQQLEAEAKLARQEWEELYPGREVNELAARIPQIEAAKARLGSAQANKRTAQLSLQRTRVYAPMDARILSSSLDVGQIVAPGQAVGRLVAMESIELAVPVSLDQLAILEPAIGREATYVRRGVAGQPNPAELVRVDASLDARTRLSNLYLVPESREGLRIGDFVDVTIQTDALSDAMVVPATALTGQNKVWVIENGRLASRVLQTLGERNSGGEIIVAPFDVADGVVTVPPLEAEEGQEVTERVQPAVTAETGGARDGAQ